ncbi:histone-lysine N-methyltransferase SETMAR-like [Anoplophora glabripennis]|uniref:histone-lysine N-methyltransferase SETMAR-like n=1 Tax=Anoplophora glabripennis TaxID=217634 RepID=UPI0008743BC1|nr:histone-lysine N-methyltransferase SETMAR-like [Anoplophora glabripennis]
MFYHFEKDWTAAQSLHNVNDPFGEGTIECKTAYTWPNRFQSGDTSLNDELGRGRLANFDVQALLAVVEEDESLKTKMLVEDFNANHSTTVPRPKKLGKVWKLPGRILDEPSDNNKADWVRIFTELQQRNEQTPIQKNVTGDEP